MKNNMEIKSAFKAGNQRVVRGKIEYYSSNKIEVYHKEFVAVLDITSNGHTLDTLYLEGYPDNSKILQDKGLHEFILRDFNISSDELLKETFKK